MLSLYICCIYASWLVHPLQTTKMAAHKYSQNKKISSLTKSITYIFIYQTICVLLSFVIISFKDIFIVCNLIVCIYRLHTKTINITEVIQLTRIHGGPRFVRLTWYVMLMLWNKYFLEFVLTVLYTYVSVWNHKETS